MKTNLLPSLDELNSLFFYDKDRGLLIRKRTVGYNSEKCKKGAIVGTVYDRCGHLVVGIKYTRYYIHRLIWKIENGSDPLGEMDHIDGCPANNKIENLRVVTRSENNKNMKIPSHNKSGTIGVCWNKSRNKWRSQIQVNGKSIHLGHFKDKNAAIATRQKAEKAYEFHTNHGKR